MPSTPTVWGPFPMDKKSVKSTVLGLYKEHLAKFKKLPRTEVITMWGLNTTVGEEIERIESAITKLEKK